MAEINVESLLKDPAFVNDLTFEQKVSGLKRAGMPDDRAKQVAIIAEGLRQQRSIMLPQPSLGQRLGQIGKQAALPTAGGVVGGVVAPAMGTPPPIGQAVGSFTGEAINQLVGITDPSLQQLALSLMTPMTARGGAALLPRVPATVSPRSMEAIAGRIPGHQGAFIEAAREQIEGIPAGIRAETARLLGAEGETISGLFGRVRGMSAPGMEVAVTETGKRAKEIVRTQAIARSGGTESGRIARIAGLLQQRGEEAGQTIEFLDIQRRGLEGLMGSTKNKNIRNQAKFMLRGIFMDIDNAAKQGHQGAISLQKALEFSRRDLAAQDFEELLNSRGIIGPPRPADGLQPINVNRILDGIKRAREGRNPPRSLELFAGSLPESELDDIQDILEFWNQRVSPAPPPKGVQFGSGRTLEAMGAGFVLGPIFGVSPATGAAAVGVSKGLLSRILMSPQGREILRGAIQRGVPVNLTEVMAAMVLQGARQLLGPNPTGMLMQRFEAPQLQRANQ